jgi:GDP-L-fucose synthase
MKEWYNQRILVTGGSGFLGTHVIDELKSASCPHLFVSRSCDYDLRHPEAVARLYAESRPEVVIHLAAVVGGIGANRNSPGRFLYDNLMMGIQMMEQARLCGVSKFVAVGTVCAYPQLTPVPFSEDTLWDGYPEETHAPYGLAKQMLLVQAQAYRQQYGLNAIYLLPVNLYGPHDSFDPERSHVIPALIKKCIDAVEGGARTIEVWGTGTASREFLYVRDCARAILLAVQHYDKPDPVNIGSGSEISIRDLTCIIAGLVGFTGEVQWDSTKPDGQPRRCLNVTRARHEFGFRATTDFVEGLRATIDWYRDVRRAALAA